MAWKVFETDAATAELLAKDDTVSRQSLTFKEGSAYGATGRIVVVEGSEDGCKVAAQIVTANKGRESPKAEVIYKAIKDEEAAAEGGVGFVFG